MAKRQGVYFTALEVAALRSDFETAHREIAEELMGDAYGDDATGRRRAAALLIKLGRILGVHE